MSKAKAAAAAPAQEPEDAVAKIEVTTVVVDNSDEPANNGQPETVVSDNTDEPVDDDGEPAIEREERLERDDGTVVVTRY